MTRILVVDDDKAVRTAIKTILEHHGFDVVVAEDGRTGVAAVQEKPFDVIIVDILTSSSSTFSCPAWTVSKPSGSSTTMRPRCR